MMHISGKKLMQYAIYQTTNNVVFVDEVVDGENCGCICLRCKRPLIAHNTGEYHWFSHYPGEENCKLPRSKNIRFSGRYYKSCN